MKKEYSVAWIDNWGGARKIWDSNGRTKKYTLEEARQAAIEKREQTGRRTKVCKGWTVIETFEV
jgi:hypothetical protein